MPYWFTFLVLAYPGRPGHRAIKRVCVCACVRACMCVVKMEWCTTFTHFISTVGLALSGCLCYSGLVEDGYHQNPYHNAVHAADVTQAVNCFMLETKVC